MQIKCNHRLEHRTVIFIIPNSSQLNASTKIQYRYLQCNIFEVSCNLVLP